MAESGTVYLVGAGPGDPGLLTVRGLELIRRADIILYDALANPAMLDAAPPTAERIHVGKRSSQHAISQQEINQLLWEKAQGNGVVVRLKGGDPYVLGRGMEEAEYLRERGVKVEVVPGVSSATAVATAADISLTQRGVSSTFAVVTGRQASDATFAPAWDALAQIETVVILMGVGRAAEIADALIAGGKSASTPVVLIADGTLSTQQVRTTTLAQLGGVAAEFGDDAPVTIIVGEVTART